MALDAVKNFAKVVVSTGYDDLATSVVLTAGQGARLPQPSTDGAFNMVWWNYSDYKDPADDPNKEIVRVTARATDTLTVLRGQEWTAASVKDTVTKEYRMVLGLTKKMIDDINSQKVPYSGANADIDIGQHSFAAKWATFSDTVTSCFVSMLWIEDWNGSHSWFILDSIAGAPPVWDSSVFTVNAGTDVVTPVQNIAAWTSWIHQPPGPDYLLLNLTTTGTLPSPLTTSWNYYLVDNGWGNYMFVVPGVWVIDLTDTGTWVHTFTTVAGIGAWGYKWVGTNNRYVGEDNCFMLSAFDDTWAPVMTAMVISPTSWFLFGANISANNLSGNNSWDNAVNTLYSGLAVSKENVSNKVTSISGASTDTQYASAKLLFDQLALKSDKTFFKSSGRVWYVDVATGSDSLNDGKSVYRPFATLQHAIDSSSANDSIKVANGAMTENITIGQSKSRYIVLGNGGATDVRITGTLDITNTSNSMYVVIEWWEFTWLTSMVQWGVRFNKTKLSGWISITGNIDNNIVFYNCYITGAATVNYTATWISGTVTFVDCDTSAMLLTTDGTSVVLCDKCHYLGKITHTNGALAIADCTGIYKDGSNICISSTAAASASNFLSITNTSFLQPDVTFGILNKTGSCFYQMSRVVRSGSDVLTGTRVMYDLSNDTLANVTATNYTAVDTSVAWHLAGINTKLGTLMVSVAPWTSGNVLTSNGSSWVSSAPAGWLSWASSVSWSTGTWVTLTMSNSYAASWIGESIVIGNTQTNILKWIKIDLWSSAIAHSWVSVVWTNAAAAANAFEALMWTGYTWDYFHWSLNGADMFRVNYKWWIIITPPTSWADAISITFPDWWASSNRWLYIYDAHSSISPQAKTYIEIANSWWASAASTWLKITLPAPAYWIQLRHEQSAMSGVWIQIWDNSWYWAFATMLSMQDTASNAPWTWTKKMIDWYYYDQYWANSRTTDLYIFKYKKWNNWNVTDNFNVWIFSKETNITGNTISTTGSVLRLENTTVASWGTLTDTTNILDIKEITWLLWDGRFINSVSTASGAINSKTNDTVLFDYSRTNTATTGTVADNFNLWYYHRTNIQNGTWWTFTSSGSVMKFENSSTQTAGTLTDSVDVLQLLNSSISTWVLLRWYVGWAEKIQIAKNGAIWIGVTPASNIFLHIKQANVAGIASNIRLEDTTSTYYSDIYQHASSGLILKSVTNWSWTSARIEISAWVRMFSWAGIGFYIDPSTANFWVWMSSGATARLHLPAWQDYSWGVPLKFTAGTNLTSTPEDGSMEYDGTYLYFTVWTTRKIVSLL